MQDLLGPLRFLAAKQIQQARETLVEFIAAQGDFAGVSSINLTHQTRFTQHAKVMGEGRLRHSEAKTRAGALGPVGLGDECVDDLPS